MKCKFLPLAYASESFYITSQPSNFDLFNSHNVNTVSIFRSWFLNFVQLHSKFIIKERKTEVQTMEPNPPNKPNQVSSKKTTNQSKESCSQRAQCSGERGGPGARARRPQWQQQPLFPTSSPPSSNPLLPPLESQPLLLLPPPPSRRRQPHWPQWSR
jgi:hypothetical protein